MRITISKRTHNYFHYIQNPHSNHQIQNNKQQLSQNAKEKERNPQKDRMQGQYAQNDFCCERWLASNCFEKDKARRIELQNEVLFIKPQPSAKKNAQRTTQAQQKIIVVSNGSQQKLKFNFPRTLQVMRGLGRRQIKILGLQLPKKLKQNQQTKKNAQLPLSREISVLSSISKQQIGNKRLSMIQSCEYDKNSSTTRKLNLTMSRKSKLGAFNNQIGEKSSQEGLSTQKKETQSIIYDKKQTTIHQSSLFFTDKNRSPSESEFKIVDPFDELKSHNTEYLKQKIAFSSVESEREQFHHHISQSIFVNHNNLPNPFLKKQAGHSNGAKELFKEISLKNQESISSGLNSQESVVLEKNLQKMFKFSLPSFSKIPSSDQSPFAYTSTVMNSLEYQKSLQ